MNYGDFTSLFMQWLNRSDLTVTLAHTLIQRAMARVQREVRVPPMERLYNPPRGADGTWSMVGIPDDYLAIKDILADGQKLYPVTLEQLLKQPDHPGYPKYFSRIGGTFLFRPRPITTLDIVYYGQFGDLVADTDTNVILSSAPEVLLWAALAYAGDFYRMDEAPRWDAAYQVERDTWVAEGQDADFYNSPQGIQLLDGVGAYL